MKWNPAFFDWSNWIREPGTIMVTRRKRFHLTDKIGAGDCILIYGGAKDDVFIAAGWVTDAPHWCSPTPSALWTDGETPSAWYVGVFFPPSILPSMQLDPELHQAVRAMGQTTFFPLADITEEDVGAVFDRVLHTLSGQHDPTITPCGPPLI